MYTTRALIGQYPRIWIRVSERVEKTFHNWLVNIGDHKRSLFIGRSRFVGEFQY